MLQLRPKPHNCAYACSIDGILCAIFVQSKPVCLHQKNEKKKTNENQIKFQFAFGASGIWRSGKIQLD